MAYKRNMGIKNRAIKVGLRILVTLAVSVTITTGIGGHLKGAEGAIPDEIRVENREFRGLSKSEAEEVRAIWRVIGDQEIVTWDGKE